MSLAMAMSRVRVRIRSWKDVVAIILIGLAYWGLQMLFERVFGWDEKKAKTAASILAVVLAFIIVIIGFAKD